MRAKRIASFRQLARVMDRIFFHRRKRPFFLLLFFGRAKKKKRNKLSVHPLVHVEHGELVGTCVGGVVAVVGEVGKVVAVGFEVCGGVEEVVFSVGHRVLHFAFPQAAVDAEGEGFGGNIVADVGDGALLGREQGLAVAYAVCCRIGVGLRRPRPAGSG